MPVRTMVVDVDSTLVDDNLTLFPGVKEKLVQWKKKYTLICWSHTGGEYAHKVLEDNGLLEFFMKDISVYLPKEKKWIKAQVPLIFDKPDIITDDHPELILDLAAKLRPHPLVGEIENYDWWKKSDNELFSGSRTKK